MRARLRRARIRSRTSPAPRICQPTRTSQVTESRRRPLRARGRRPGLLVESHLTGTSGGSLMMKRALVGMMWLVTFAAFGNSFAVSDGHYRPDRNHCTTTDDNSDAPKYVNPDCKSLIFTLSDGTGHECCGAGARQTPDGTFANTIDFWVDPGQGQMATWYVDSKGLHGPTMLPSKGPSS